MHESDQNVSSRNMLANEPVSLDVMWQVLVDIEIVEFFEGVSLTITPCTLHGADDGLVIFETNQIISEKNRHDVWLLYL